MLASPRFLRINIVYTIFFMNDKYKLPMMLYVLYDDHQKITKQYYHLYIILIKLNAHMSKPVTFSVLSVKIIKAAFPTTETSSEAP